MMAPSAILVLLLAQVSQEPYARTRVNTTDCEVPARLAACVHWEAPTVSFQQATGGGANASMHAAVSRAIETWSDAFASCGHLAITELPSTDARDFGWRDGGQNVNTILFHDRSCGEPGAIEGDCWDHPSNFLALTTSTYQCGNGSLLDTDIEVNARDYRLTTVDGPACTPSGASGVCTCASPEAACVVTDVMNSVVHELGHAVGLDHTLFPGSTMGPSAGPGETHKRTLDEGTLDFVCDVYAPGAPATSCVVRPVDARLGPTSGCSAASSGPTALLAALCGLWLDRRLRSRRSG